MINENAFYFCEWKKWFYFYFKEKGRDKLLLGIPIIGAESPTEKRWEMSTLERKQFEKKSDSGHWLLGFGIDLKNCILV